MHEPPFLGLVTESAMRKFIIALLAATTAMTPALAQRAPNPDRDARRAERQASRAERQAAREAANPYDTPRESRRADRREDRLDRREDRIDARTDTGRWDRREDRLDRQEDRVTGRREAWTHRNQWDRPGQGWNSNWRHDRRYDWQAYRNSYRHIYRAPRYYAPYGYNSGYRRFGIGITLGRPYYASNYWISDPYRYRLPPAGHGYRWVRYYDDVLLVDTYRGRVVDVIHNFFW